MKYVLIAVLSLLVSCDSDSHSPYSEKFIEESLLRLARDLPNSPSSLNAPPQFYEDYNSLGLVDGLDFAKFKWGKNNAENMYFLEWVNKGKELTVNVLCEKSDGEGFVVKYVSHQMIYLGKP